MQKVRSLEHDDTFFGENGDGIPAKSDIAIRRRGAEIYPGSNLGYCHFAIIESESNANEGTKTNRPSHDSNDVAVRYEKWRRFSMADSTLKPAIACYAKLVLALRVAWRRYLDCALHRTSPPFAGRMSQSATQPIAFPASWDQALPFSSIATE